MLLANTQALQRTKRPSAAGTHTCGTGRPPEILTKVSTQTLSALSAMQTAVNPYYAYFALCSGGAGGLRQRRIAAVAQHGQQPQQSPRLVDVQRCTAQRPASTYSLSAIS